MKKTSKDSMAQIGKDVGFAITLLKQGKVVAIPTDTVYGLAALSTDEPALKNLYKVKNRPLDKAIIGMVSDLGKAGTYLEEIPSYAKELANSFWPGALTLVLKAKPDFPKLMIAGGETLGLRVPNHPMAAEVLNGIDYPLAVTSANKSGQASPTTSDEVNDQIGDQIDYILDGGSCALGFESTIVGFRDEKPVILRHGAITKEQIFKALNIYK